MSRRPKSTRPKRGFVLLMVLVVLVIVSLILAKIAQQGMRMSVAARERVDNLQREYARISCERAVLPQAHQLFERSEQELDNANATSEPTSERRPLVLIRGSLFIGKSQIDLTLGDENAKLNVNQLYRAKGLVQTDRLLKQVVPPGVPQQLRPGGGPRPFESWGQIYALQGNPPTVNQAFFGVASSRITCWGDPVLNYRRCDRTTLKTVLELELSPTAVEELSKNLTRTRETSLNTIMLAQELTKASRDRINEMLVANSTTFSLKTEVISRARNSTAVAILQQPTTDEDERLTEFRRFLIQ